MKLKSLLLETPKQRSILEIAKELKAAKEDMERLSKIEVELKDKYNKAIDDRVAVQKRASNLDYEMRQAIKRTNSKVSKWK